MILNIRGPSGSGKSTAVRQFLKCYGNEKMFDTVNGKTRLVGYRIPAKENGGQSQNDIYLLGSYETACGGCDKLTGGGGSTDLVESMVSDYSKKGHVIFEGLLISTLDRWIEFAKHHEGFRVYYMDTPLDQCIANVKTRNGGKAFNHGNVRSKHRTLKGQVGQMQSAGVQTFMLPYERAFDVLHEAVREAGFSGVEEQ